MSQDSLSQVTKSRWNVQAGDGDRALALAAEIRTLAEKNIKVANTPRQRKLYKKIARLNKTLASLLLTRGIATAPQALRFLCPDRKWLHDPYQLPDMEVATERIRLAKERGEKVMIHGDYDVDGITATALLVLALRDYGLDVSWHLPHRLEDGYGLTSSGIETAKTLGCTLMITVDCGVSNPREVEYANSLGLDVIVTDHHLPPEELPPALAVVNPKRRDSRYPFAELAGVGLAWKLAMALNLQPKVESALLQLVVLGTVADLVPLLDENRVLTSLGLAEINNSPLPGIASLATVAGCQLGKLDSGNVAYGLAPRLNAAGRMDSANTAVALLLEEDAGVAQSLAQGLDAENQRRRRVEDEIFQEALVQAHEQVGEGRRILVLHAREWHPGVVGIVASRIVEEYYRPTIILCGQDELTGSARSIPGFDIHAALTVAKGLLENYGGHPGAAGLTLKQENLEGFRTVLEDFAHRQGIDTMLQPVLDVDASLNPGAIDMELVVKIDLLQPFGQGNPEPTFALEGFHVGSLDLVGRDKSHLRLRLDSSGGNFWAIGFGQAPLVHYIDKGKTIRVAGHLLLNHWNGHTSVQIQFRDVQGPSPPLYQGRRVFDRRSSPEPWLTQLTRTPGTVFFANTQWSARRLLGTQAENLKVIILSPDIEGEKVYNLGAKDYCFLDPAWTSAQLKEVIDLLPEGAQLHFFSNPSAPEDVLRPNLNLLRVFYRDWRQGGQGMRSKLLGLLPQDLAEPLLLERILTIFAEAGLAGESQGEWRLAPIQENVDLTTTQAWIRYSRQLEEYRNWLRGFKSSDLDQLLA